MSNRNKNGPLVEAALASLAQAHAAETAVLRNFLHRYEQATAVAQRADAALREALDERNRLLAEWVARPGCKAEHVAEFTGMNKTAVLDAERRAGEGQTSDPLDAQPVRRHSRPGTNAGGEGPQRQ